MIRKFRWIALVLAVFMVVSCTSGTPEGRGSVEFRIGGSSGSKTLLPEEIADPDYYSFTLSLRDGSEFSSDTSSNKNDVRFETNDEGKYIVDGIKPGTYAVTIEGCVENNSDSGITKISIGNEDITVKANEQITKSVNMKLISDSGFFGSARVTFDWSDIATNATIKDAMENKGGLKFSLYYRDSNDDWILLETSNATGSSATQYTFNVDRIPASSDRMLRYTLESADGIVLNSSLYVTAAQIYSGITSTVGGTSDNIVYIKNGDISEALNVYNIKWEPVDGSSVKFTWNNQYSQTLKKSLFQEVYIYSDCIEGKATVSASGETSEYTMKEMVPGKEYTVKFQALTVDGILSDYEIVEHVVSKVSVSGVEIDTSSIPDNLHIGTTFSLTANVSPDEATNKEVTWSTSSSDIFTVSGNSFTAKAVGKATITATSVDNHEASYTTEEIVVKLAAPTNVKAVANTNTVDISWTASEGAVKYEIYRTDIADSPIGKTEGTETTFSDPDILLNKEYSYQVKAIASDTTYSSALSEITSDSTATITGSAIEINPPSKPGEFEIEFKSGELVFLPNTETITVSVANEGAFADVVSYEWIINSTTIKKTTGSEDGSFITINKSDLVQNGQNRLTLHVTTSAGAGYSASLEIGLKNSLPTSVTASVPGNVVRLSNKTAEGAARTVKITASASYADGTVEDVYFVNMSSDIIEKIDADGTVTFKDGYGPATVRVYAKYTDNVYKDVVFDIYTATVTSAEDVLNAVNGFLKEQLKAADEHENVKGDWWPGISPWYYPNENVVDFRIKSCEGGTLTPDDGQIEFDQKKISANFGEISVKGTLTTTIHDNDTDDWWGEFNNSGWRGTDSLSIIGKGNESLEIELPYNQGTAYIQYNQIDVLNKTGSYIVSFNSTLGFSCYNAEASKFDNSFTNNESMNLLDSAYY